MIEKQEQYLLMQAGKHVSMGSWVIGDTASKIVERHSEHYTKEQILREVAKHCGLSWRRVDKIMQVCRRFPYGRDEEISFGYYERAFDFGDEAEQAIEFIGFFEEEYGRTPSMTEFPMMFQQHILGKHTDAPVRPQEPRGDVLRYLGRLRHLIRQNYPQNPILLRLLDRLEQELETLLPVGKHAVCNVSDSDTPQREKEPSLHV